MAVPTALEVVPDGLPACGHRVLRCCPGDGSNERSKITIDRRRGGAVPRASSRWPTSPPIGPTACRTSWPCGIAVVDGDIWFETKAKSQKVVNLRRDPADQLPRRGRAHLRPRCGASSWRAPPRSSRTPTRSWAVGVSVWERYNGPYSEEVKPLVEFMLNKRVAVRIRADRTRTWDHRKLGMPPQALGGSTAGLPRPDHLSLTARGSRSGGSGRDRSVQPAGPATSARRVGLRRRPAGRGTLPRDAAGHPPVPVDAAAGDGDLEHAGARRPRGCSPGTGSCRGRSRTSAAPRRPAPWSRWAWPPTTMSAPASTSATGQRLLARRSGRSSSRRPSGGTPRRCRWWPGPLATSATSRSTRLADARPAVGGRGRPRRR